MADGTCSVDVCDVPVPAPGGARGMCGKHYVRWKKLGDPLKTLPRGWRGTLEERFWRKVDKNGPIPERCPELGPCWVWIAALDKHGYGAFGPSGKRVVRAHRFAYALLVKPVPDELDLDHLCRNHACVNPAHLEPVPHRENCLRGTSPAAHHARKKTCPEGHDYDIIVVRENGRTTRRCSICTKTKRDARPARHSGPIITCACGCGATFPEKRNGRSRRWLPGHATRRAA